MKKIILMFLLTLQAIISVHAQNVYFTGVGRALMANDRMADNADSASLLKSSGGYTMFDLGVYAKPNEVLRGGVIMRTRNEFGGFFADGAGFEFRQMQLEGIIAKKVKYDIGDIYLTHTPYTLWNDEHLFGNSSYESNLFAMRRNIVNYENFFVGNAWRMQGVNTQAKLNFNKGIQTLSVRAYGGRTAQTNFLSIPDRYFYGGKLDLTQSKYIRIAANLSGISDIAGTVKNTEVRYNNMVYTSDFALSWDDSEYFKVVCEGETGASKFSLSRAADTLQKNFQDYFYDIALKTTFKPLNLTIRAAYRDIGFNFNSPMAQTRRIAAPGDISLSALPVMNNDTSLRALTLFDVYSQEYGLYNQSISTTLMAYHVQYDMVEPYGKATPNRRGFTFSASMDEPKKIIKTQLEANMLSEIASEGDTLTTEKRKFTKIKAGLTVNLHTLIGFEKCIAVQGGVRTEQSKRTGANPVNLSGSLIDAGIDVEILKSLHLLGGIKFFNVKGDEVQTGRDEVNQIISYGPTLRFNQQNNIIASGIRYDYDDAGYFSMHYQLINYDDKNIARSRFDFRQWFFVFGLKF